MVSIRFFPYLKASQEHLIQPGVSHYQSGTLQKEKRLFPTRFSLHRWNRTCLPSPFVKMETNYRYLIPSFGLLPVQYVFHLYTALNGVFIRQKSV